MMQALVADGRGGVELRDVDEPSPAAREVVVEVRAVSLNRGEVRRLGMAEAGWRPGWDVSGTVVTPAADGSGPDAGARVVGLVGEGGWAQRVAIHAATCAPIPDELPFAAASTLPVAGLTAYRALACGGVLDGQRVLVTGAAGGVGRFAVQLAAHGGAHVTAVVGSKERGEGLADLGAHAVVDGSIPEGPFDIVLESVGGAFLAAAIEVVAPDGTIVSYGNSSQEPTTFDVSGFYPKNGAALRGFLLFSELERTGSAVRDLAFLAGLTATGRLDPQIDREAPWRDAPNVLRALMAREVRGKAVLHID